ncbi:MAG TPA: creatininase family protein [Pyrinomonadaceae bacterium]|nr:creatininase family protein [Pyrinomonadaceae bacterium]
MTLTSLIAAQQLERKLSQGGYSIFDETMADMTYQEVEDAARRNAIVLWPMGVIEQHGPHLPLGTDIYDAYLEMKQAARLLKARGQRVVIAPPMYWGINEATGSFGGSFSVRPATLKSIIEDTFFSLRKDGFQTVYIVTGHGDRLHNQTILEGVERARATTGLRGFVVLGTRMRERLGLTGREPHVLAVEDPQMSALGSGAPSTSGTGSAPQAAVAPPRYLEVHAGAGETSMIWHFFPDLVKADLIKTLEPTKYGPEDLAEWRKGWDNARQKTPLGYFGDPASADPKRGGQMMMGSAARIADAITKHIESSPWMRQNK